MNSLSRLSQYSRGFTLLEMLLAVAVFALVGLAAATALSSILDGQAHYGKRAEEMDKLELTFTLLEKDLAQLQFASLRDADGDTLDSHWRFSELDEQLEWLSTNLWSKEINPNASSLSRVTWSWDEGELRRSTTHLRNPDQSAFNKDRESTSEEQPENPPLLVANDINWRFYHREQWLNYPPTDGTLPAAVELTLSTETRGDIHRRFLLPTPPPKEPNEQGNGGES